jgi:hypothetical protein
MGWILPPPRLPAEEESRFPELCRDLILFEANRLKSC